ncbi:MAG TPA: tetratricopeptide repeat protein [Methylobacter sp.]|jgi:tetratricopeptide (TPR) repeat protein
MEHADTETLYLVEERQAFSNSMLWDIQRHYFAARGAEAWRSGEVPHYVTSNPVIADAYAEIVFAFWRDRQALFPCDEPLYLCELGSGSGRFAFHFLRRLLRLCARHRVPPLAFCYVLTDFTQSNLDAWRRNPCFGEFFDSGLLDMALFDVNHSAELVLQIGGERLTAGTLRCPLVAIANYLFDSVPQELYYFKDGIAHECLLSLATDEDPAGLDAAELLERLRLRYDYRSCAEPSEEAELLALYSETLDDAHVLVPAAGLGCLRRLRELAPQGLLLLSADKGEHRIEKVGNPSPPGLVHHGSFSLSVNYHAFRTFCEQAGGLALLQEKAHDSIAVVGLLMVERASEHEQTRRVWEERIQDFSPGEYLAVSQHARAHISEMGLSTMLAYVRLGLFDSHLFAHYLPRLRELAPEFDTEERSRVGALIDEVWAMYFPLGEDRDLPYGMACLLYEMDDYPRALQYFERSLGIYGPHTGTYYNMAVCYHLLNQPEQALPLLQRLLETDPGNAPALELLNLLSVEIM